MPGRFYLLILLLLSPAGGAYPEDTGTIQGRVTDAASGRPLASATVLVVGTTCGTYTAEEGTFRISEVPYGVLTVQADYIGYESGRMDGILLSRNSEPVVLEFALESAPIQLSQITVTPGHFAIMGSEPVVRQTLTKTDIQTISQTGDDIYRAITRLPGIAGNDFSAKFTIRGGENEEVLVLLDGLELYEPFHVKDVSGGILSIVDATAIEGIDLITGGFPAEYGDRTSGVFNIRSSKEEKGRKRLGLGVSLMNTRFFMEGTTERSSWLLSARRGYLDLVLQLMKEENNPSPTYYDILGKFEHSLAENHTISANLLTSYDSMDFTEDDRDNSNTHYGNSYGWIALKSLLTNDLLVSYHRQTL